MGSQGFGRVGVVATAFLLAACAPVAPTAAPTAPTVTATAAPTVAGTTKFTIAIPGPNVISWLSVLSAADSLRSQGYTIETINVADPNTVTPPGLDKGTFHFAIGDTAVAFGGIQAGLKFKIIGESVANTWQIVTTSSIKTCKDLEGRSVGVFGVGSFNDTSMRAYVGENCPGTKINILVAGPSGARSTAMLAGRLDSSPLFLEDAITLLHQGGDKFHILASFSEKLPGLRAFPLLVSSDFLAKNPGTVRALLKAVINENRKLGSDAAYFKAQALKHMPNVSQATLDTVIKAWQDQKLFTPNGTMTDDDLNFSLQFFVGSGNIRPGLRVSDVGDLSIVKSVLDEVGRK